MKTHIVKSPEAALDPIAIPSSAHALKNGVLSIRMNEQVLDFVETELAKLGVDTARERQDFYRGAILSAITNARRAKSPAWHKFVQAIQPQARKHLGLGLDLDGAEEIIRAGSST